MTSENWGFEQKEEDYPLGIFDDFDGKIANIEFTHGTFKDDAGVEKTTTQIHVLIKPLEYEYEAREIEWDEDSVENIPQQWYSLGGGTYVISDDLMEITSGPNPQRNARIVRFIKQMREAGFTPEGKSVVPYVDAELHWKAEETKNWRTGQIGGVLWPVGPSVGRSMLAAAE